MSRRHRPGQDGDRVMALTPALWISARPTTGRSMRSARPPIRAASGASPPRNIAVDGGLRELHGQRGQPHLRDAGSMAGPTAPARSSATCNRRLPRPTIIHGGKQAMPFEYNNVKTPYYSEAERTFDTTAGLDHQRGRHPGAVLPGLPDGLRGQGRQRLHRQQHRHGYLGQQRSVPLRLSSRSAATARSPRRWTA